MHTWPYPLLVFLLALFPRAGARSGEPAPSAAAYLPNYAGGPQMSALHRWERFPVRVFFETAGAYTAERKRQVLAGFDQWAKATKGVLGYTVVGSAADADVTIRFHPGAHLPPGPGTLGRTTSVACGAWLERVRIDLATGGASAEGMSEVAAHEWGHALGISGHSDDPDDLMYGVTVRYVSRGPSFATPRPQTPSRRDLNTIKTAYAHLFAAGETPAGATTR